MIISLARSMAVGDSAFLEAVGSVADAVSRARLKRLILYPLLFPSIATSEVWHETDIASAVTDVRSSR